MLLSYNFVAPRKRCRIHVGSTHLFITVTIVANNIFNFGRGKATIGYEEKEKELLIIILGEKNKYIDYQNSQQILGQKNGGGLLQTNIILNHKMENLRRLMLN